MSSEDARPTRSVMRRQIVSISIILLLTFAGMPAARSQWVYTQGPANGNITALAVSGSNLYAGVALASGGIYLSADSGTTWEPIIQGLPDTTYVYALAVSGTNVFAGTWQHGVYISIDSGKNWKAVNTGLPINAEVISLATMGTNIFAGTEDSGVYRSTNNGSSWASSGLFGEHVPALAVTDTILFAASGGVYLTTNYGNSWTRQGTVSDVISLAVRGTNIFAGSDISGSFLSTDGGISWSNISEGLSGGVPEVEVNCFAVSGTNIFASANGLVFLTTNDTNWIGVGSASMNNAVDVFAVSSTNLFAGTAGNGVWRRPLSDFNLSGVAESAVMNSARSLRVFPNPESGELHIIGSEPGTVHLFDLLGRERMDALLVANSATLDVSSLPPGMYFVSDGNSQSKFVKQ